MNFDLNNSSIQKSCTILNYLIIAVGVVTVANVKEVKALNFNLISDSSIDANALAGFQTAANIWSNALSDDITVNLEIGFENIGDSTIIAQAQSNFQSASYSSVRNALVQDVSSSDDVLAITNLPDIAGDFSSFAFIGTEENGDIEVDGYNFATNSSATSRDNTDLFINRANAKALGLDVDDDLATDARIVFNSNFSFDLDRSDGIAPDQVDFVGIATHEIGHALGFSSGVNFVDVTVSTDPNVSGLDLDNFAIFRVLDLYRHSDLSLAVSEDLGFSILDLSVSGKDSPDPNTGEIINEQVSYAGELFDAEPYISIDGGLTPLNTNGVEGLLATGVNFGDGREASHWKDDLGIGLLDPTVADGELLVFSDSDLRALDIIGFDLATSASVPFEFSPGLGLFLVGGCFTWYKLKKR